MQEEFISFTFLFYAPVTVHACVPSNGICCGFAFKYGKFLLPPRFLTALSVPKVPTRKQYQVNKIPCLHVFIQQLSVSKPPVTKHNLIPSFPISATARASLQGTLKTAFQPIIPDNPVHPPVLRRASARNIRYFPQSNSIWSAPPHIRASYLLPHTASAPPERP